MSDTFADRLNFLFENCYPPGRGRYRAVELTASLHRCGVSLSGAYLSQLRSGKRVRVSRKKLAHIAAFFRIEPQFFTNDRYYQQVCSELSYLAARHNPAVRKIAAGIHGLSEEAQAELVSYIATRRGDESIPDQNLHRTAASSAGVASEEVIVQRLSPRPVDQMVTTIDLPVLQVRRVSTGSRTMRSHVALAAAVSVGRQRFDEDSLPAAAGGLDYPNA